MIIDKIFDELEQECATNMSAIPVPKEELLKRNLCPKYYKEFTGDKLTDWDNNIIEESYYCPIISKEILEIKHPLALLTDVLMQQLRKHNVNFAPPNKAALFLKTDGWLAFFGVVPSKKAVKTLQKGMLFIDPPDYPDTDSRLHGAYSHVIQEYIISKLLEKGYLGNLTVQGEPDITERELVQADAWLVKNGGMTGVSTLFDIMRERRRNKFKILDVYPDEVYGFTSPDFINQYLMLNPFRFPHLSTLLYNQYAHSTFNYFSQMSNFDNFSREEQLAIMNIYNGHTDFSNNAAQYLHENPESYTTLKSLPNSAIALKTRPKPLFQFSQTKDDSASYIRAQKKAAGIGSKERKFDANEVLLLDSPALDIGKN
ncbi:hypothetical protein [Legionella jamestowniensis]|uniref:hypothetical protein n=1 Tax=Legionella jamestowniensis TaxID=455 RepID=UPI00187D913D|nr:hypothetical protein [Legionella jamestowniensis]